MLEFLGGFVRVYRLSIESKRENSNNTPPSLSRVPNSFMKSMGLAESGIIIGTGIGVSISVQNSNREMFFATRWHGENDICLKATYYVVMCHHAFLPQPT